MVVVLLLVTVWAAVLVPPALQERAARRDALVALDIQDRRFGWPLEMVLRAAYAGWRIDEVPVPYAPRSGRSKVTGTVSGTMRAVRDMSRVLAGQSPTDRSPTAR